MATCICAAGHISSGSQTRNRQGHEDRDEHDGEPGRQDVFRTCVADAGITGYAADDGAALHFTGNQFAQALSSGESSSAYLFRPMNGGVEERALPVTYLGTSGPLRVSK